MNVPGFVAQSSLGKPMGTYCTFAAKGSHQVPASGFNIQPALPRYTQCTTIYSGYVTYPQTVCESPHSSPVGNVGLAGAGARTIGSAQLWGFGPFSRFCRTHYGPWLAYVVRRESCDSFQPDDFTLTIRECPSRSSLDGRERYETHPP
jgi:hypothetical protein